MKIPKIPNHESITLEQALINLIDSITNEEKAIAHLITAEAEKISTFNGKEEELLSNLSSDELLQYCQSVSRIADSILIKEWLLFRKLETILQFQEGVTIDNKNKPPEEQELGDQK